ncbi:hypothetical protein SteCoe_36894 [Stentor coeruleus]|uniref:C2H2-type domain-containing protein n=1 Tax=Stentor coeruleus TaxID=5963 RepID=A0A1R2AP67_9CILI|nr:hypothetical protein SteCoe_36894 [Stentor coeruleus]
MDTLSDKKKRRSKKDSEGRSYTCECGKSYLSYQALYTHKRTKHTEAIKLEDLPKKKRGRPKGIRSIHNDYDPCLPLGDNPLARKVHQWKDTENIESCDEAFAGFLIENSKTLSKKEYKQLAYSVIHLRECINLNYIELRDPSCENIEENYTSKKKPMLIPKISNIYILNYLPNSKYEFDKESEVNFMLQFFDWLLKKNYTDLEVSIVS